MSDQKAKRSQVIARLLWKEAQTIKPLVIAIAVGVIGFNLLAIILHQMFWQHSHPLSDYVFWILMPNLIALGAPAMLIGTEQETGTMEWMRTLPVRWQQVVLSKFVTAMGATLLIWLLASIVLWVTLSLRSHPTHTFTSEVGTADDVFYFLFFSFVLLFCGFITSFLLRSPVAAILAVVPLVFMLTWFCVQTARMIKGGGTWGYSYAVQHPTFAARLSVLVLALMTLGALVMVASWLGRRRLTAPLKSRSFSLAFMSDRNAFRPPRMTSMSRSSPLMAMLWQQWRQVAGYSLTIFVVNVFFAFIYAMASSWQQGNTPLVEFAPLVGGLSFGWLGCLVFYGDGVRRQCGYFADRGVSPTLVWCTRLLPVMPIALALALLWWWSLRERGMDTTGGQILWMGLIVMFAAGQMVAIWLRRPTLSFFASPVYAWAIIIFNSILIVQYYHTYWWTLMLVVPVLLLATWRLTPRWLEGRIDLAFHWRAITYSLLAAFLPCLVIFADRWATTPPALTQWRSTMMSQQKETLGAQQSDVEIMPQARTFTQTNSLRPEGIDRASFRQSLMDELEGFESGSARRIGAFANAREIYAYLRMQGQSQDVGDHPLPPDTPALAVKVLLSWARLIRTECAAGERDLHMLCSVAEPSEQNAVAYLLQAVGKHGASDEWLELIEMIPDASLRRESRRRALASEWQRFNERVQRKRQETEDADTVYFASIPVLGDSVLPFEKNRALRFLDLAVEETLDSLDSDLTPRSSPARDDLVMLWHEALAGPVVGPRSHHLDLDNATRWLDYWTSDHERSATGLREKYLRETPTE